jgi:hypothetical protein
LTALYEDGLEHPWVRQQRDDKSLTCMIDRNGIAFGHEDHVSGDPIE